MDRRLHRPGGIIIAMLVETTALGEIKWLSVLFGVSALNFTLRATIPLALGAMSGILCERSGIINIGIEGMMLAGAFAGSPPRGHQQWPLMPVAGGGSPHPDWRRDGTSARHALHSVSAWDNISGTAHKPAPAITGSGKTEPARENPTDPVGATRLGRAQTRPYGKRAPKGEPGGPAGNPQRETSNRGPGP